MLDGETHEQVLDAIPAEHRTLIVEELERRDSAFLAELLSSQKPTNEQSDRVVDLLSDALMKTFGPEWAPNEYGLAVERAIDAYLEVWPIYRSDPSGS
ncbi:hypothetical protein [Mycobacterium spongiae]|uniref:Uncharacterized protein n=1 Tax=Mycobacterium spongiae TaxID=886343 RepID=A0A975PY36_9MYCO|nr:hypothetical protein [Mycobacterium spongiae]QUR68459.1 hypothetical protein F6B93_16470 [Mycobacterium spongiae]